MSRQSVKRFGSKDMLWFGSFQYEAGDIEPINDLLRSVVVLDHRVFREFAIVNA